MNIPDELRQRVKSRQAEKNTNKKCLSFLNFAGKRKAVPAFFCIRMRTPLLRRIGRRRKKIFRQKAHLKTALVFCHVPQCDVMVPAQIEKNAPVHGPLHESAHCLSRKPFPLQTHTPLFSIGMIGIITLIETSPDRFSLPPASPPGIRNNPIPSPTREQPAVLCKHAEAARIIFQNPAVIFNLHFSPAVKRHNRLTKSKI